MFPFFRQDTKEAQLYAAQAHLKLGEVSVESGNTFSVLLSPLTHSYAPALLFLCFLKTQLSCS